MFSNTKAYSKFQKDPTMAVLIENKQSWFKKTLGIQRFGEEFAHNLANNIMNSIREHFIKINLK